MNDLTSWLIEASTNYPHLVYAATIFLAFVEGPILSIIMGFLLQQGYFSFFLVALALMVGDLIGDVFWYGLGRFFGEKFIKKFGKYIGATEERVKSASELFMRHKNPILIISKMTNGFGFALVTLMVAGMVRIPFKRYFTLNLLGQFVWTGILLIAGYFFGNFFSVIEKAFGHVSAVVLGVFAFIFIIIFLRYTGAWISSRMDKKKNDLSEPGLFFSIVIPAHNEETCIGETMKSVNALDYPKNLYEVIVVENGSSDATSSVVEANMAKNVKLLHSEPGVSRARNVGIKNVSPQSQWIILADADTKLLPAFLREFNDFLLNNAREDFSVGTSKVLPGGGKRLYADLWFAFYNWGHKMTHTSFSIQFMKAFLRHDVLYDETAHFSEDLKFIKDLKKYGRFFFFDTDQVITSTRRFDKVGWFKLYFIWLWEAQVLSRMDKKRENDYPVIR